MYHKSFVSYFIVFFFILGIFFFQYEVFDSDLNVNFTRKVFENYKTGGEHFNILTLGRNLRKHFQIREKFDFTVL